MRVLVGVVAVGSVNMLLRLRWLLRWVVAVSVVNMRLLLRLKSVDGLDCDIVALVESSKNGN